MKRLIAILASMMLIPMIAGAQSKSFQKGYYGEAGINAAMFEGEPMLSATTTHGYNFGNGLFFGGEFGVHAAHIAAGNDRFFLPLLAKIRYSMCDGPCSPYFGFGLGTCYDDAYGYNHGLCDSAGLIELGLTGSWWTFSTRLLQLNYPGVSQGIFQLGFSVCF